MTEREIPVEFTGRHEKLSERMREHAVDKLSRLARYNDRIARIEIVADHAHDAPDVEILVHFDSGAPMVSKVHADKFSDAIDALTEKMEKQLKKDNEKRKDHRAEPLKHLATKTPRPEGDAAEPFDEAVRRDL